MEPLTPEELAALRAISTPTICNAIETFDVRPRSEGFMDSTITCRFPELGPVIGYAVTAKISAAEPPGVEMPHAEVWAEVRSYTEALAGRNRGPRVPESGRLLLGRGECQRVQGAWWRRDRHKRLRP